MELKSRVLELINKQWYATVLIYIVDKGADTIGEMLI